MLISHDENSQDNHLYNINGNLCMFVCNAYTQPPEDLPLNAIHHWKAYDHGKVLGYFLRGDATPSGRGKQNTPEKLKLAVTATRGQMETCLQSSKL